MAGRLLLPLLLLLALLPLPAPAAASARDKAPVEPDLRRCPGLKGGLPPFAAALRASCPVSAEGCPAEEVRVCLPALSSGRVAVRLATKSMLPGG